MPWKLITPTLDIEVAYKRAPLQLLAAEPRIRLRDPDGQLLTDKRVVTDASFVWKGKGETLIAETKFYRQEGKTKKEVPSTEVLEILNHYQTYVLDPAFSVVDKEKVEILHYEVLENDQENLVQPFKRFGTLEIPEENWVPSTNITWTDYLIESIYELFTESPAGKRMFFEEAEKRLAKDQVGIAVVSWGGFKQQYVFVFPYVREGKFGWLAIFCAGQVAHQCAMDIPERLKIPIKEAPTLQRLPPVQALIVATPPRKKTD
jgi:hypothetical protein